MISRKQLHKLTKKLIIITIKLRLLLNLPLQNISQLRHSCWKQYPKRARHSAARSSGVASVQDTDLMDMKM